MLKGAASYSGVISRSSLQVVPATSVRDGEEKHKVASTEQKRPPTGPVEQAVRTPISWLLNRPIMVATVCVPDEGRAE